MKNLKQYLPLGILLLINGLFFYKTFIFGRVPFPGDLLVSEYKPWQTSSYLGYNPGSIPSKSQYFDTIRQLYPWKMVSSVLLKTGQLPLWNPYNFSGAPLLANFQSAIFYPLTILYVLLPLPVVWTLGVILQHFLTGFFTYLFTRKIGVSRPGALLAALAYSYSLFMTVFSQYNTIGHTIAWLPLILLVVEHFIQSQRLTTLILLVCTLAISLFAGHLQLFGLVFVYGLIYAVFRVSSAKDPRQQKTKKLLLIGLAFLLSLGVGAIQLAPTFELVQLSARASQPYQFLIEKLLIAPYELIKFFSPDIFGNPATRNYLLSDTYPSKALYIGLIPLVFAWHAIFYKNRDITIRFFALSSAVILIFLIRSSLTEAFYRLNIPLVSSSSPSNALFLVGFGLAILSGFGLDQLHQRSKVHKTALALGLVCFLFIAALLTTRIPLRINNALYTGGLGVGFLVCVVVTGTRKQWQRIGVGIILILTALDLFYFFQKFNPFVPPALIFPSTAITAWLKGRAGQDRFWGYGTAAIEANFASALSLYSPDGYDPLYPSWYGKLLTASGNGTLPATFTNQTRSDAVIVPGYGELDLPSNSYRLKLLNLLGVKYILDRVENQTTLRTFPTDTYQLLYESEGWKVFENTRALPRTFLTNNYRTFSGDREFERLFFAPDFNPTKTILLEQPLPQALAESKTTGTAQITDYSPNRVTIGTATDQNSLLFLSDTYYPGWRAYLDGGSTPIYRADYSFRAVYVPAGNHTVEFRYQPDSFYFGAKVSMMSVGAIVVAAVIFAKKRRGS